MIYSKSSADFAARYDLRRCFRSGFFFPLCAAGFFILVFWSGFDGIVKEREYIFKIFGSEQVQNYVVMQYAYAFFGALTGISAFSFLTSVKKCNVYLSMGISRNQLVKNRIMTSVVYIAASVILPMIVIIAFNKMHLSVTSELIKACVFYGLSYFCDMLIGFGVAGVFMVSVGNLIEGIVCTFAGVLTPSIIWYFLPTPLNNLLNGSAFMDYSAFYDFEGFCRSLSFFDRFNPLEFLDVTAPAGFKYIEGREYSLNGYDYLTVILWLGAAMFLLALIPKLMKKRKAEIAGALGKNKGAVGFVGAVCAYVVFCMMGTLSDKSMALTVIACTFAPAIIYTLVTAVIIRNKKDILKNLKATGLTAVIALAATVSLVTGFFGGYYKTPDAEDIEYVGIMPSGTEYFMGYGSWKRTEITSTKVYGPMTDDEDIKSILSMHETVVDGLSKGSDSVGFVIKTKDGKYITRFYRNVSVDGAKASLKVVDTNWYKKFITDGFTDFDFDYDSEFQKLPVVDEGTTKYEETELGMKYDYLYHKEFYNNGEIFIYSKTLDKKIRLSEVINGEEIKEFRKIFSDELKKLSAEEIFYPKEQPVAFVRVAVGEELETGEENPMVQSIPVYSVMKKTVAFLDVHKLLLPGLTSRDVASMKLLKPEHQETFLYNRNDMTACASYLSKENIDKYYFGRDSDMMRHNDDFYYQDEVTDRKLIEKYFACYKSYCSYSGDDGKYVKFIFKDGSDLVAYVSQKDL